MNDDDEPTPEEQRQAEALARALAGEEPASAPPPEALETAAFLRYAHNEGKLDPARQEAIGARLRAELSGKRGRRRRSWLVWLAAPLGIGATAVVVLAVGLSPRSTEMPPLTSLPAPTPALLAAQAEAARGRPEALGALDAQMRSYRRAMLERLHGGGAAP